ncbi:hypothetical protein GCM10008015_25760 [Flavobacterium palustre]|uniref:Uncharacterized protein n=2 Tax=Flavobacterium palustre TaxID=1476463 RepID=A0ABQ1HMZ7_9FLAO|nr:hypothetical protein GCM10008015_25760 [Flavobacterium palustre]
MVSNNPLVMPRSFSFIRKIILNPYIGIAVSLVFIIPNLYIILEDVTVLRKEYFFLAIGVILYIKSLSKIFDNILELNKKLFK